MEQSYISIKEVAESWGISPRQMQMYCKDGRIPGAKKIDNIWVVPKNAKKPENIRNLTGEERRLNIKHKVPVNTQSSVPNIDSILLRIMSHEARNTLNAILGYSEMIESQKDDIDNVIHYTNIIKSSGTKMLGLLNNVSDLRKLYNNELKLEEHIFNVDNLLENVITSQQHFLDLHKISVNKKIIITNEYIYGDEEKLAKILGCILNNAIKFSKKNNSIDFTAIEEPSGKQDICKVKYVIQDYGSGISKPMLNIINQTFENPKLVIDQESNGLGLIMAKKLTDYLGGTFTIESTFGSGTSIIIEMEHRKADLSTIYQAMTLSDSDSEHNKLQGKRVLIADDNEINRDIAKEILRSIGVKAETAEDGIICIAMLEQHPDNYYDLILMDLQMPNVDGVQATVLIRGLENSAKNSIPIVAMTANVQTEIKSQALKAGMNGFVEKPFNSQKLFKVIENCIFYK